MLSRPLDRPVVNSTYPGSSGSSTLEQGVQLYPQFLDLRPQFGTMPQLLLLRIILPHFLLC